MLRTVLSALALAMALADGASTQEPNKELLRIGLIQSLTGPFNTVGKATVDVSGLGRHPNIHLLGRRPYAELPGFCKAFDVAVCPFVLNELTRNVNPIKLREYLSAGVPTVSTAIPEAAAYSPACRVATDRDGFLAACEAALAEGSAEERRRRSDAMRAETWEGKAEEIGRIVQHVKARKRRESEHALGARTLGAGVWP